MRAPRNLAPHQAIPARQSGQGRPNWCARAISNPHQRTSPGNQRTIPAAGSSLAGRTTNSASVSASLANLANFNCAH